MSDLIAPRTVRFILVHGTWGRGFFSKWIEPRTVASDDATRPITCSKRLRWFDAGSDFRRELTDALESRRLSFTTRVFLWDGANSIASRNKAAASLATQLEELAIEHPNDPIVIVAHSHGGNIALRAAHIAGKPSTENLRVITIATPFLQIRTYTSFHEEGVAFDTPYLKDVVSFSAGSIAVFLMFLMIILAIGFFGPFSNLWALFGVVCAAWFLSNALARRLVKLPTLKLEALAPANGFNHVNAHDAMGDVEATIFIALLVNERAPEIWKALMPLAAKPAVIERALSSEILSLTEYFMGTPHSWLVVGCGQNPEYDAQLGVFDLRYTPPRTATTTIPYSSSE